MQDEFQEMLESLFTKVPDDIRKMLDDLQVAIFTENAERYQKLICEIWAKVDKCIVFETFASNEMFERFDKFIASDKAKIAIEKGEKKIMFNPIQQKGCVDLGNGESFRTFLLLHPNKITLKEGE